MLKLKKFGFSVYFLMLLALILTGLAHMSPVTAQSATTITTAAELENLLSQPIHNARIYLQPGDYDLRTKAGLDSTCGNCEDPAQIVPMTYGLWISGKNLLITSDPDNPATIHTNAGYGIYFYDCQDCTIEHLTITGGERDSSSNATDAAIVVKNSTVTIRHNRIFNNIGNPATVQKTVVGIMGIAGREKALINIFDNEILRNSWDGIALFRGASANIANNLIDGIDKAVGDNIAGGRGVALGVTWNADANIQDNVIKRYWKGIGLFVDATAVVERNIVEDMVTWGIALWDAGKGKPVGHINNNIIYNTGACGVSITRELPGQFPGQFRHNAIVRTGQNPRYDDPDYYCYQCALAEHAVPANFSINDNLFFGNRRAQTELPDYDMDETAFQTALPALCTKFGSTAIHRHSDFIQQFCED